jgi:hypothetical protein
MSDDIENPETIEKDPTVTIGANPNDVDDLEAAFNQFNENVTKHKAEEIQQAVTPGTPEDPEIDLSQAENFKLQIFTSLMFNLLDGLHVFIYGFISKYKLSKEDIELDEDDREGLQIYFRTQRVMNLINRLPVEIIGFIHMEYLYFEKFREYNKKMKELDTGTDDDEEPEDTDDDEEPEETPDEKMERIFNAKKEELAKKEPTKDNTSKPSIVDTAKAPTKKAAKKAAPKKAAPKKAAPKKAVKKAAAKKENK